MKQALLTAHREFDLGASRELGKFRDQMAVPDDFDAPLPNDVLDAFEGKPGRGRKKL